MCTAVYFIMMRPRSFSLKCRPWETMMSGVGHSTKFYNCRFYAVSVLMLNFHITSYPVEQCVVAVVIDYVTDYDFEV